LDKRLAAALGLLLYDIPHMATNGISPDLFKQLILEIPSLAGVKSSRPDAQIIRKQIQIAANRHLVLVGNEAIALASLAMGASGLISGLSTAVPEPFVALTNAFAAGNLAEAQRQHQLINQLLALLPSGARIGSVKQILTERGFAMGTAVPPRPMPTQPIWPAMQPLLQDYSLIP
jgi:dihydrodipicolinate synthase/N-acetylneuraminate lyase